MKLADLKPPKRYRCHKLVREVARTLAEGTWETNSSDNHWRALYPEKKAYIRAALPYFIEPARATMAKMLAGSLKESLKEEIKRALVLDNELRSNHEVPVDTRLQ